jgi:hypothetical protein
MNKFFLLIIILIIISCGISKEELQRRHQVINDIQKELREVELDTTLKLDVKEHNINFYKDWLKDLKERGYY